MWVHDGIRPSTSEAKRSLHSLYYAGHQQPAVEHVRRHKTSSCTPVFKNSIQIFYKFNMSDLYEDEPSDSEVFSDDDEQEEEESEEKKDRKAMLGMAGGIGSSFAMPMIFGMVMGSVMKAAKKLMGRSDTVIEEDDIVQAGQQAAQQAAQESMNQSAQWSSNSSVITQESSRNLMVSMAHQESSRNLVGGLYVQSNAM
jgi:hypothetical protein